MSGLAEMQKSKPQRIFSDSAVLGHRPKFFGSFDRDYETEYNVPTLHPKVDLFQFSDATVIGWTDIVMCDGIAAYPDQANVKRYLQVFEIEGRGSVDVANDTTTIWLKKKPIYVDQAISLLGQSSTNYAHWITEALPRLAIINQFDEFADFPILIDTDMHPNIFESLAIFDHRRRPVVFVEPWQKVVAKNMICLDHPCFTPADYRSRASSGTLGPNGPQDSLFSGEALQLMRERAFREAARFFRHGSFMNTMPKSNVECWDDHGERSKPKRSEKRGSSFAHPEVIPERVYLRRKPGTSFNRREIANVWAVEEVLNSHGFLPIDPTNLSFLEQVEIMSGCKCVVSSVGAALANTVFAPEGCDVIVLAASYKNANFSYFSGLLSALGHNPLFVLGPQIVDPELSIYRRKFLVDTTALAEALSVALDKTDSFQNKVAE